MTREQLDRVPDHLLAPAKQGALALTRWLHARGWRMSLAELDRERRRRGLGSGA